MTVFTTCGPACDQQHTVDEDHNTNQAPPSPIVVAAQALAGLLRTAEDGGLTLPLSAEVLKWPPFEHPESGAAGGIEIHVGTLADLTEWAIWLDQPIGDRGEPYKGAVTNQIFGMAGPVPVRVWTRVPVASEVQA